MESSMSTAYPSTSRPQAYSHPNLADFYWRKNNGLGSRKLYWQITIGLLVVCLMGATFIGIGAVYIHDARQEDLKGGSAVPLLLCVVALVGGGIMLAGSFVMRKLLLCPEWRHRHPMYRCGAHTEIELCGAFSVPSTDNNNSNPSSLPGSVNPPPSTDVICTLHSSLPPPPYVFSSSEPCKDVLPPYEMCNVAPPQYEVLSVHVPHKTDGESTSHH